LERNSSVLTPLMPFLSGIINPQVLMAPRTYRVEAWTICYDYFLLVEMYGSMILVLLVGPGLISQDLRFNALPLYFSRPLRRIDYFLGKLGVIGAFIGMVMIVPSLIAYVLGLLFSLDLSIIKDTFGLLLCAIAYGVLIAVASGLLMLALSSLSRNSRYVGLFWIGLLIMSSTVAGILNLIDMEQRRREAYTAAAAAQQAQANRGGPAGGRQGPRFGGQEEYLKSEIEASKSNWRPLVSYTQNLSRMGRTLLRTDAAWMKISELQPPGMREVMQANFLGPQFPWYWSAGVLTALFGLSACILNFRIRSLDRLR
jgi:ABC-2 type transport system permease protein